MYLTINWIDILIMGILGATCVVFSIEWFKDFRKNIKSLNWKYSVLNILLSGCFSFLIFLAFKNWFGKDGITVYITVFLFLFIIAGSQFLWENYKRMREILEIIIKNKIKKLEEEDEN
ncbi:MAG: hypothetical protein LBJ98_01115 [Endomicrobium sp.]|nr:hypothetical protein [Endomicrobium sp.]